MSRGMKVNGSKTKLICISDALSYHPEAQLKDINGSVIKTCPDDTMKMLGFHFSTRPTVNRHIWKF